MAEKKKKITSIQINKDKFLDISNPASKFLAFNWFCINNSFSYSQKNSYLFEIFSGYSLHDFLDSEEYSRLTVFNSIKSFFKLFYIDEYDNFIMDYISNYKEDSDLLKMSRINDLIINLEKYILYNWKHRASLYIYNMENSKDTRETHEIRLENEYLYPNYLIWSHLKGFYDLIWDSYSGYIDRDRIKFNYAYSNKEKPKVTFPKFQETPPQPKEAYTTQPQETLTQPNEISLESKKHFFSNEKRDEILKFLIGDFSTIEKFEKYEKKLITRNFLNDSRDTWLTSASDFLRFYNYCHKQSIFKSFLQKETKGVRKLRALYNFHTEPTADAYGKRQLKETKTKKDQFNFLD